MASSQHDSLRSAVLAEAAAGHTVGEKSTIEWVNLGTDVGYSCKGWCRGGDDLLRLIKLAREIRDKKGDTSPIRVLEIGPGLGELVPAVLELGCSMDIIGEAHHVDAIVGKYGSSGNLSGISGWFPEAMPAGIDAVKYDFIFASRVIHCAGLAVAKKLVNAIFAALAGGGTAVIETTSPWSSYYEPFVPDFVDVVVAAGSIDNVEGFEVGTEQMRREGLTVATVALFTKNQARKLFESAGFEVEIEPFLMPPHPTAMRGDPPRWDQVLAVQATRPQE